MGVSGKEKDRHDYYFKKARAEHYRARSVYKLKEIQAQFKLMRPKTTVVDLGAAPGSWSQYAAEVVGTSGKVVAIDRTALEPGLPSQVLPLQLDMLEVSPALLRERAGVTRVDGVLSDMAPNTSGIRGVDHQRSVVLCEKALAVAELLLEPGGWFVCKIFQGQEVQPFLRVLKDRFEEARIFKPKASKDESVETFLVAQRYKGAHDAAGEVVPVKEGWNPLDEG